MKRNGKTTAGTQRWRYIDCEASSVRKRRDLALKAELDLFLQWLMGTDSQAEIGPGGGRTFRRSTQW
ncbi:hypothetical protein [Paeniglutamicibacter sp. Y32M11]|uniref:hypothetical protein n=1 Tax=Paeniglutamicibacter sp. Y32M11 TaxID=2853258 RepID=UPI001C52B59A|nr:hypothetical protein [Paeniglutamicibacter sp. Y32M11]QXQ10731.1 hypothetical protein KUF55_01925 [Paeniglutamicibacter sp. Y32M11]